MRLSCCTNARKRSIAVSTSSVRGRVNLISTRSVSLRDGTLTISPHSLPLGMMTRDVIVGVQLAVEEIDLARRADDAAGLDPIADMERPEKHQHDAGGEIAERALQRKADGNAQRAQHGDEACRGDAESR